MRWTWMRAGPVHSILEQWVTLPQTSKYILRNKLKPVYLHWCPVNLSGKEHVALLGFLSYNVHFLYH